MMKKLILFLYLAFASTSFAADPVLFFSDLINGPDTGIGDSLGSGAIVTIWGKNLGNSQGSNKVYFKDSATTAREAAYVYYWVDADGGTSGGGPADLNTYHGYQEIAFSIPDSATGAGTIYVEVGGVDSNTLPFTVRSGDIFHVKSAGSDTGGCGSWASPCATADYVADGDNSIMTIGDITYTHDVHESQVTWDNLDGTLANQSAIVAYPGTTPEWESADDAMRANQSAPIADAFVVSKIILKAGDGNNTNSNDSCFSEAPTDSRFVGNYLTDRGTDYGTGGSGAIHAGTESNNLKFFGNEINHWGADNSDAVSYCTGSGTPWPCCTGSGTGDSGSGSCRGTSSQSHQTYFTNRSGSTRVAPEVAWNLVIDGNGKNALHFYDEGAGGGLTGNLLVHDNVVVNERASGIVFSGSYVTSGEVHVYNNIIIGSGLGDKFTDKSSFPQCGIYFNANGTYKI
jgi:hypothetical protein